ncbi:GNAT family N-acetyltransferase [Bacillus horti]|uniref:GNAT family N-acyltransferase n=1 Tax=Caldalkalibacillus horti TaxID=77523 RepID=A0ABT9W5N4_9BACI|nr:GNAT family N-acetyltransferase [Bacillus horti]MDQ0168150.1 putative GNAT family N-acyltransferase [Bacillus horti]
MTIYQVQHVKTEQQLKDAFYARNKVFVEEQQVPAELEIDEHEDHSEHFVIYDSKQAPVGAGRLRPISETDAKVERICVLSELRGQGIGLLMMQELEKVALERGIHTLYLHAQDHAEAFYQKLGYATVSEPFEEAGIVHVKMKKNIK